MYALSRHVGSVLHNESLSPDFLQEQGKYKYSQILKLGYYSDGHEFFSDDMGLIYRSRTEEKHLLVPQSLVHDVIKANHDPVYAALTGVKRTCDLIALSIWWPGMRKSVQEYVQKCASCQRRKDKDFIAPLGRWRNQQLLSRSHPLMSQNRIPDSAWKILLNVY